MALVLLTVLEDFSIDHKILSVTCDNALNNNTMVTELDDLVVGFSTTHHTQCFAHVLNLIAKSLLKQFDVKPNKSNPGKLSDNDAALFKLAEEIETKESMTAQEMDDADSGAPKNNEVDGWVDELEALTPKEHAKLEESIQPVKRTLVKVRGLQHCIPCANQITPAMESCLQYHAFNNETVACMEGMP